MEGPPCWERGEWRECCWPGSVTVVDSLCKTPLLAHCARTTTQKHFGRVTEDDFQFKVRKESHLRVQLIPARASPQGMHPRLMAFAMVCYGLCSPAE